MLSLAGAILSFIMRLLGAQKPQQVQEGENLGRAQAQLDDVLRSDQLVTKADAAGDAVARDTDTAAGLRDFEAHDPNNRDNQS